MYMKVIIIDYIIICMFNMLLYLIFIQLKYLMKYIVINNKQLYSFFLLLYFILFYFFFF